MVLRASTWAARREAENSAEPSMTARSDDLVFGGAPGDGVADAGEVRPVMEDLIQQSQVPRVTPNGLGMSLISLGLRSAEPACHADRTSPDQRFSGPRAV